MRRNRRDPMSARRGAPRALLGAAMLLTFSGVSAMGPATVMAAAPTFTVVNSLVTTTPSSLAQVLLGPGATLDAGTPPTVNGAAAFAGSEQRFRSYGSFTNGDVDLGLSDGLVIAANADAATFATNATVDRVAGNRNDAVLDALLRTEAGLCTATAPAACTRNATDLSFAVEADGDFIKFEYVLAITENGTFIGPEWHPTADVFRYPDGFGLFVGGENVTDNCAVVPSTGQYLTMKNAKIVPPTGNAASNRAAALATVAPNQRFAYAAQNTAWRVRFLTVPLTCVVDVSAEHLVGTPVTVRIVIADANDASYPPAVFLKGGSIRFEETEIPTPPAAPTWADQTIGVLQTGVAVVDGVEASGFPWPTYSISGGTLPAGLAFNISTGAITGTPTVGGAFDFTITAGNGVGSDLTKQFTGVVTSVPSWLDDTVGGFVAGVPVVDGVSVSGHPAATYSISAGSLPTGLTLDISTGAITGTPTVGGAFDFTITAGNGVGSDLTKQFTGVVTSVPSWLDDTVGGFVTGVPVVDGVSVSGHPDATYQISAGALPAGLTLDASTGAITGTPTAGGPYDFTITAGNGVGSDLTKQFTGVVSVVGGETVVQNPVRLVDTRSTGSAVDARSATRLVLTDVVGVPDDTTAVVLNVTVTNPQEAGFITLYPCGTAVPLTSSLNFGPGVTVANTVTVSLGDAGEVCVFASVVTDFVIDLTWVYSASVGTDHLVALNPSRLVDTRDGDVKIGGGAVFALDVGGHGIPDDATSVLLNVTVTEPETDGYMTVYACDAEIPVTSNVNFVAGATVPNTALVRLSATGEICFYTSAETHLVVDLNGVFTPTSTSLPVHTQPERVLDTRTSGLELVEDIPQVIDLSEIGAVVDGATAVTLNVTIVDPQGDGFATVYPCEAGLPVASNLNFTNGVTVANSATVPIGSDMKVCIRSTRAGHLVVDLYAVYVDHI